ncbi:hypothetical protein QBC39DRAFT_369572 [Podospora conica]|nr:hypothetical protein QBC39DRAFT_369572 [Schizothecium conicum]
MLQLLYLVLSAATLVSGIISGVLPVTKDSLASVSIEDGVDHASLYIISAQSSGASSAEDIDPASSSAPPDSSITSSPPVSSDEPLPSAEDGIDRASAITITQTTPTAPDGIDHAPVTTLTHATTSLPDGIDRASVVTLSTLSTSTTSSTSTTTASNSTSTKPTPTSTTTLFVTPPPVYTTVTVPPKFVNTSTIGAEPTPTDTNYTRFCPWCYPGIPPSVKKGDCNLVVQLPSLQVPNFEQENSDEPGEYSPTTKGERFPWAVLDADFTTVLDWGLARWDRAVLVSLSGGRMQMSGNRFWVGGGGGRGGGG